MDNIALVSFLIGVFLTVLIGLPISLNFALHEFKEGIEIGKKIVKTKGRYNTYSEADEETEE